jgi:chromosome segregation ATPase
LMQCKRELASAQTELKATQLRLKHVGAELSEKRKASKAMTKEQTALQAEFDACAAAVRQLETDLKAYVLPALVQRIQERD